MNNKKRMDIEINRPIQNIGEIRNVIVEMGYDFIYLTDDEAKKLLITGVLTKETDKHLINIRLRLLNMDDDMRASVGKIDPVKDHGEIYGFDSFIDNLIATDMTGRADELVVRFYVNHDIIIDKDDEPMTVHECMEFLRDFMVDDEIDDVFLMLPMLTDDKVYSPDDDDIRYAIFHSYRYASSDNEPEDEEDGSED